MAVGLCAPEVCCCQGGMNKPATVNKACTSTNQIQSLRVCALEAKHPTEIEISNRLYHFQSVQCHCLVRTLR